MKISFMDLGIAQIVVIFLANNDVKPRLRRGLTAIFIFVFIKSIAGTECAIFAF
jgi:hypothetical protein